MSPSGHEGTGWLSLGVTTASLGGGGVEDDGGEEEDDQSMLPIKASMIHLTLVESRRHRGAGGR